MAVKGKAKQIAEKASASASTSSSSRKRKISRTDGESSKKKFSGVSRFVDDAAKDADFEEEEEEEDDFEWEMDEDFEFELPDIGAKEVKNATKGSVKSSPLPFFIKEEELNDDELEEAIKERYRGSGFVSLDEDVKECDESLSLPRATKYLSFWRVKCMMGRERQSAFCLMQKFVDLLKIGKQLQIFSVFALEHVQGFVYVEAEKACNVFEACNGLCFLYPSRIELVPRNEAPNLLSIQKKACGISKGMWVRMKSGKYKGDLAEVVLVNDAKKRVTIKLVPRIDLQAIAKKFGGGASLKAAAIPAPRLISSHELEDFRPQIEVRRDRETGEIFEVLDGLMLKDGYLYKKVSMGSLIHWGVQPSSDELTKFEDLKDEAKDVSWLSSIYKTNIKKKIPETSNQKNGEKSNQKNGEKSNHKDGEKAIQMDGDKQRTGFDIDDFVLFGKKDCGIIIDNENDTFKILKGDVNGSEVVTINIRVIKKNCVDRVFTATDRCKKTISIDDVVKVFEGPLEGREGFVRHMYKGVLFIYDECQSENNGFFCAKSEICDLVKKSRDFGGGKLGGNVGHSFAQSPIRSSMEDDNSQSFSRNGQSSSRGTFTVGQTLRICKGPLKGYLCRVIRIYRADVTVKLDSLGKLLTVDEKLLSFSNSKRDDATAMQCDTFGSQEGHLTGGSLDAGGGLGMDNFEFNAGMSSVGRDSWSTPSCSNFAFSKDNDSKDHGAANSWGKAPSSNAEQSSWNKMESGEKGSDAWNKASTKGETSTGGWQIDTPDQKTGETGSTKGASSGWNSAVHSVVEHVNDAGGWSQAKPSTTDSREGQTFGTETSGWERTKPPSSDGSGSWNTQGANVDGNKETSRKDRAEAFGGQMGDWASSKSGGGDNQDSWGIKGKGLLGNDDDNWSKSAASKEINPLANNPWKSSFNSSVQSNAWKTPSADENHAANCGALSQECAGQTSSWDKVETAPSPIGCAKSEAGAAEIGGWKKSTDGNQAAGWAASAMDSGTSSFEDGSQSNSWSQVKSLPSSSGWEKSKAAVSETVGVWKTTTDSNQAAGWGTAMSSATPVEHESQTSSWDKVITSQSSSQWQISKPADATEKEGWKKDGFPSEGQIDRWNKGKSSDTDQASGWNKAGNSGGKDISTDSWGKAKSQESQGQWKAGVDCRNDQHDPNFGKSKDFDSGQGSGWSQGHSNNENGESWGRGNSWNQQRDFDGGRGSSRGSGRGRYGGRGGRNQDSFEKPGDSDGSWSFGRGRGRGRNGSGGYNRDNSDTREFGRGRGRSQGRGQGQDQGQFDSSDWRSGRERFGSYPNKPSSSWGATEGSDEGKSRDQQLTGVTEEKVGWNSWNSNDGGNKPGWGTDSQDPGRSKNEMNEDLDSGWSKGVSTGKQIDNWSKETTKNDNCNTTKTFDNKLSSWNQTSNNTAKEKSSSVDDGDSLSGKLNSNDWSKTATLNKEDEAAGSQGGWSNKKVDSPANQPSSETANNWDSKKELTSSQGNWGGKDSAGNQSSDWSNGGGNNWSKQGGGQGNSQSWTRGSDFGRGGGRRDNSFSRGRGGFGRNSGGRNSYGWNNRDDSAKEGNDEGQAYNSNQEFKTGGSWSKGHGTSEGEKSSWNSGGNAEKCSGWGASASASVDKVESSSADGAVADGSTNWNSSSSAWDSKKELISSQPNWGQKDNSGSQSWENGNDVNKWGKQSGSQDKSESWSRQSDFSRGGGRSDFSRGGGRSDFSRGGGRSDFGRGGGRSDFGRRGGRSDFGRGGGRGRDGSFSDRGRGLLGRYSGGRGYSKEGNDGGQTSNSNQEFKTGGSWNSGGNAEKNSWGSWKSEGENQPAGRANLEPEAAGSKSSWDPPPAGFGSNKTSDWVSDSSKDLNTANAWGAAHETKVSDGGSSGEQKNSPWVSTNAVKMGQDSSWNSGSSSKAGSGWN